MRLLHAPLAVALLCTSVAALAQSAPGRAIIAPSGYLPAAGIYCDDGTGHAALCGLALDATAKLAGPADDAVAIVPSDSVALASVPKALLVTAPGTLAVKGAGGVTVSLGTVAAGQVVPVRVRYVMATGTTATVVGLY